MFAWLENPLWRYVTFSAAGTLSFGLAVAVSFPDEDLKEIAVVQLEKVIGPKYKVRIDDLDLWWLSGATLEGIQLEERVTETEEPTPEDEDLPADLPTKVRIESLSARFAPLSSLFNLAPTVVFQVDVEGGIIEGSAGIGKTVDIHAEFNNLDLRKTPALVSFTGMPFFGELSGEIDWTLDSSQKPVEGAVKLSGSQLTIGPATIMTDKFPPMTYFEIPQTNFGSVAVNMEMKPDEKKGGALKIAKFETSGRDIRLEAWGDVTTAGHVARARPNVQMRLQLDDTFVKKNDLAPLLNVNEFRKGKGKEWYGFSLTGSVDRIQFKGSSAAANGPKDLEPAAEKPEK